MRGLARERGVAGEAWMTSIQISLAIIAAELFGIALLMGAWALDLLAELKRIAAEMERIGKDGGE